MIKWLLDKDSKVPLYLQLKDQIKYHISTGSLLNNEKLPAINELARELSINFETVRKAYKELEKEELISMQRAIGSLVTLDKGIAFMQAKAPLGPGVEPEWVLKNTIGGLLKNGRTTQDIQRTFAAALAEALAAHRKRYVIFTECNTLQTQEISSELQGILKEDVRPVLLADLANELARIAPGDEHLQAVVTTGFHLNDVRAALGHRPTDVHVLITNMSPESRRKIDEIGADRKFGFICRDQESILLYNDLLKAEFGKKIKLTLAYLGDKAQVDSIIRSVDILLVTPPVYREVKKLIPASLPIFNVFDRIDPMSIRVLRERLSGKS
ncbi:MAG: GntR family transcriptional regulator [Planctomycetes bacterium]|nr:GntR family transcriptional regulator [Planctomycetota bacterium]